jgi:hypothetical protein
MCHIKSCVANYLDEQKKFREPMEDMLAYLERTLTPISKEVYRENKELTHIKYLLA